MRTVVLVTGGVDSTLAWEHYEHDPEAVPLFVEYGQRYEFEEKRSVTALYGPRLQIASIRPALKEEADRVYIRARNLILAGIATHYGERVVFGATGDATTADKTPEQFEQLSRLLSLHCRAPITLESPFWNDTQFEIVSKYLRRGGDPERMHLTWSCYEPTPEHTPCLNCRACFRRLTNFRAAGLDVPAPSDPITIEYLSKIHTYDPRRIWSTLIGISTVAHDVIEYDIDGVLCNDGDHATSPYASRVPNESNITKLRKDYEQGEWIILNTARPEIERGVTVEWLDTNKIPFHALLMNKPPALIRFDDRCSTM